MFEANFLVFPAPSSFTLASLQVMQDILKEYLVFIPKKNQSLVDFYKDSDQTCPTSTRSMRSSVSPLTKSLRKSIIIKQQCIPCIFIEGKKSDQIIIFFHSNAEDLSTAYNFIREIQYQTAYSILCVEYPGYTIYPGSANSQQIQKDSLIIIEHLKRIGYKENNIILMGRSIGSGPTVYAATKYNVRGVILVSPFLSLRSVVYDLYGNLASILIEQRFDNRERCKDIKSPTLIIHGVLDNIISYKHSIELACHFKSHCSLKLIAGMSHSTFDFQQFLNSVKGFLDYLDH